MQPVAVVWPRGRGYWDMAMLEHVFQHKWRPSCPHTFEHFKEFDSIPRDVFDGVVAVLPARHCASSGLEEWRLTQILSRFNWSLLLIVGDEESVFHAEQVHHPNVKRWQFLPKPGVHDFADRKVINGYPTGVDLLDKYKDEAAARPYDWFFSGQITHARRTECVGALNRLPNGLLNMTAGFTQGMPHDEYYRMMASAKIIPCPSGAVMPDSFRLAEALEAGCVPVADGRSPHDWYPKEYWRYVLGEEPLFPVVNDWKEILSFHVDWPAIPNRLGAWWGQYKRNLAYAMRDDINALRKEEPVSQVIDDKITVLIPTSPIPSHPDTYKIDQVVASVRHHLPLSEIIIMCDGPREAVMHRRGQYEEYKQRILWKAAHDRAWRNITIKIFEESGDNHAHQTGIVRATLPLVKTPLVLFNEHDAPLRTDRPIDWESVVHILETDQARIVRFYYFESLIPEHSHMFHGSFVVNDVEYVRTTQYSGWPHVISKDNMARLLIQHTPFRGKEAMLETAFYSPVATVPWDRYKTVIYMPRDGAQRFVHTNGRGEGAERDAVDW